MHCLEKEMFTLEPDLDVIAIGLDRKEEKEFAPPLSFQDTL
jgi:hypothetical protein